MNNIIAVTLADGSLATASVEDGRFGHRRVLALRSVSSDMHGGVRHGDVLAALPVDLLDRAIVAELIDDEFVPAVMGMVA